MSDKLTRTEYIKAETKRQTETLMQNGGKVIDGKANGLPYKTAKRIARANAVKKSGYQLGKHSKQDHAGVPSRRERREQARKEKVAFEPLYTYPLAK